MIAIVDHSEIVPFVTRAAKDHVSARATKNTLWFMFDENRSQPCFCALMKVNGGYRVKGVWVHPSRRGKGIGEQMTKELLQYAVTVLKAKVIQVFAYNSDFYQILGFLKYGELPNGASMLKKKYS